MMKKKQHYTTCTPIPSYIPRQLAIDLLHNHGEIITINPLVIGFKAMKAPSSAPADEYYSSWYEIEQRIQFVPGMGKMGSGKIKFHGCFHDLPWGMQTHIYAPAGVETRNKYRICGNQPGEPREPVEMGIGAPAEGLYLREDVEIKCNITMASFVKKEQKAASKVLIERMLKKAELLEEGQIQAMFENGRISTYNPNDRTQAVPNSPVRPPMTPRPQSHVSGFYQPGMYGVSYYDHKPNPYAPVTTPGYAAPHPNGGFYPPHSPGLYPQGPHFSVELPGDTPQQQGPPHSPHLDLKSATPPQHLHPAHRYSNMSEMSTSDPRRQDSARTRRWSEFDSSHRRWSDQTSEPEGSRPPSHAPSLNEGGMRSPRLDQTSFASVPEEGQTTKNERLEGAQAAHLPAPGPALKPYNPADYAKT